MVKGSRNLLLTAISLDRANCRTPLHQQLYHEFRNAIVSRRFRSGTRLPSTRALAEDLGVSRNTITNAFDQLIAEGYLEGRVGSGTYVTDALPDEMLWLLAGRDKVERRLSRGSVLSRRGKRMAGIAPFFPPVKPIPFRHGLPALDEFPLRLWNQLMGKRLRNLPRELLGYGDTAGYWPLREAIASYLAASRAVRCEPSQVIVVAGSQQAIYLTALVLLDPGDPVWIEDPGYLGARGALLAADARLVPVPVDEQGLSASVGASLNKRARLVYVTPSNQYPSTVTMSLSRRLELMEWAHRAGAWIIEDDYDSEFRYKSRPIAALQGLDKYGRVIYLGTFSKLLAPSLRLGYLVLPPELIDAFSAASALITRHPPSAQQVVLADFISQGHLARHIRRMRTIYMERQAELIEAARRKLAGLLEITPPEAGTHLVGWLPWEIVDRIAVTKAAEQGVEAKAFSTYCIEASGRGGLVLGYGAFTKKEIRAGMQRLATALRNCESKQ
jgi:GntR family transcriptional regulator/MocR family aminotransferase